MSEFSPIFFQTRNQNDSEFPTSVICLLFNITWLGLLNKYLLNQRRIYGIFIFVTRAQCWQKNEHRFHETTKKPRSRAMRYSTLNVRLSSLVFLITVEPRTLVISHNFVHISFGKKKNLIRERFDETSVRGKTKREKKPNGGILALWLRTIFPSFSREQLFFL